MSTRNTSTSNHRLLTIACAVAGVLLASSCTSDWLEEPGAMETGPIGLWQAPVTCDPRLLRYPIAGPHNGGYDAHWNDFQCHPHPGSAPDNSDYGGPHHGNDLFALRGTSVVAVTDGVVTRAGWPTSTSGNRVTIQDACGWSYYAGHLDTILVAEGTVVRAGDPIGTVGNTATTTQPHVHFNVHRDGSYSDDIDPFPLLQAVDATACGPDPRCAGRTDGSFCATATVIGTCTGGRYTDGNCAVYGTICQETAGSAICRPHIDGVLQGSTFAGGMEVAVAPSEEVRGCVEYRNDGAWPWQPGRTFLGLTEPRERTSVAPGSDWPGPSRMASVDREVPLGEVGRFCFAVRGTEAEGTREEHYSLVHERFDMAGAGQIWSADVRGLADDRDVLRVTTSRSATPAPPAEPPEPLPPPPPSSSPASSPTSPPSSDEPSVPVVPPRGDAGPAALPDGPDAVLEGGCAVSRVAPRSAAWPLGALVLLLALGWARSARLSPGRCRRRRHPGAPRT